MTSSDWAATAGHDVPDGELAEIMARAQRLGFSPERVATALGVTAQGLSAIEHRGGGGGDGGAGRHPAPGRALTAIDD